MSKSSSEHRALLILIRAYGQFERSDYRTAVDAMKAPEAAVFQTCYVVLCGGEKDKESLRERLRGDTAWERTLDVWNPPALLSVTENKGSTDDHARTIVEYISDYPKKIAEWARYESLSILDAPVDWLALRLAGTVLVNLLDSVSWWSQDTERRRVLTPWITAEQRIADLLRAPSTGRGLERLVGNSPAMQKLKQQIQSRAALPFPVLLIGETGTGKGLCAAALHELGQHQGRFVPYNAAMVDRGRLQSELFGHVKGAFTGADNHRQGRIREAEDGSFFLDEVNSLPPDAQAMLLRALDKVREGVIHVETMGWSDERSGGKSSSLPKEYRPRDIRARLITAAPRDPLGSGELRDDLYYRISMVRIHVPALRDRREDIPLLASDYLKSLTHNSALKKRTLTKQAVRELHDRSWPGNVRQLQTTLMEGWLNAHDEDSNKITPVHLGPPAESPSGSIDIESGLKQQVARLVVAAGEYALARHSGNHAAAARELGFKTGQELTRYIDSHRRKIPRKKAEA